MSKIDTDAIAEELRGSCSSLDDVLESFKLDFDDLSVEQHREIDSIVAECDNCGWWVEADSVDEYRYCEDCQED